MKSYPMLSDARRSQINKAWGPRLPYPTLSDAIRWMQNYAKKTKNNCPLRIVSCKIPAQRTLIFFSSCRALGPSRCKLHSYHGHVPWHMHFQFNDASNLKRLAPTRLLRIPRCLASHWSGALGGFEDGLSTSLQLLLTWHPPTSHWCNPPIVGNLVAGSHRCPTFSRPEFEQATCWLCSVGSILSTLSDSNPYPCVMMHF